MQANLKRRLLAGTTLATLAILAGGAYAASQALNANPRQAFVTDVAKRLNVTPAQLNAALRGAADDQLQAAVKAGRLTQAQANAIKQHIAQAPGAPLGAFLGPRFRGGFPPGRGGFAPGPPGARFGGPRAGTLNAAAAYLGLTDAQLFNQLAAGKSLAQIAKAQGKSTATLKAKLTAAITADLAKLRTAGMISATAEQQILSRLSARLDAQINRAGLAPRFHLGHFVPGAMGGPGGTASNVAPVSPGPATLPGPSAPQAPSGPVY